MPISPLHVLLYQTFFFSKNVQIRFFSKYVDFRSASFRSGFSMLQRSYTFLFFILRGIGELPNKRDWVHCIHTMYTNPLLAPFWSLLSGQIHLSGTRTKIKGIKIENLFLYKNKKKNSQLGYSNRQIFHIGTLAYYFLQSLTYNKTDNDTVTVKVSRPDRINPAGQLALTVSNRP